MDHDPFRWGRPRDDIYGKYDYSIANSEHYFQEHKDKYSEFPRMNTQEPIVTGTSVIGIKFEDGIIMAADNLGSYGSLSRFTDIERLIEFNDKTVVGISGDISDLQKIERLLEELKIESSYDDVNIEFQADNIHKYLRNVLYSRRNKMDPLWNSLIVGGIGSDNEPFLKYVDLLGVEYASPALSTGFGNYLAIPILRKFLEEKGIDETKTDSDNFRNIKEEEARKCVLECMKVLFYRDARSLNKFSIVTISKKNGIKLEKNLKIEDMSWEFAKDIKGYGNGQRY
ncbi:proteasome core particle subunit beta 7 [Ascoidea rubescens DSM 1968]|uniref:Proteasome subunit beta n=1 Tax=Ascoidea rubescens DSM 1968 TaxID=1344418 RepID=A0A1D2VIY7_9ASCO|nr:proteasome endopeptidase complex, beta subunit [Ascoidea rubescens DSM 1968]ODV61447.1 proteasome endopeptidase complex, beta subunit [Ascoidea rubescens DSM 1968]